MTETAREVQFGCCFCGRRIDHPRQQLRVVVDVERDEDAWQQWWAHKLCFRRALHASAARSIREELL